MTAPVDGGAAKVSLPDVAEGYKRAWVRCTAHSQIGFYDYVPYSASNPVAVMRCGCDTKHAKRVPEDVALAAIDAR